MNATQKERCFNKTAIIAGIICFLVWLLVWVFVQQIMAQKFSTDCTIPLKLDGNIPSQNIIQ